MILHQAIRDTYSNVFSIDSNSDGTYEAYDADGNIINIDSNVVSAQIEILQTDYDSKDYQRKRALEYPDFKDYLDGMVKGDQTQIQKYRDACRTIKEKYPKPT